jgi:hypothetical protein
MELIFDLHVTSKTQVEFEIEQPMIDEIKELIKCGTIKCDEDIYNHLDRSGNYDPQYGPLDEICYDEYVYQGDEYFEQLNS